MKKEVGPHLNMPPIPSPLHRDKLAVCMTRRVPHFTPQEFIARSLTPDEFTAVGRMTAGFDSELFQGLIDQGNITVAMVRPQANESKLGGTDITAAGRVMKEMEKRQQIVLEFSVVFDREMCEYFYAGRPMEIQQTLPGVRTSNITRWEEFMRLMTSGPTTILILYSQDGDAIPRWRKQIGALLNMNSDHSTIRGKFGSKDNYNNLVHGSDSIEAVHREIQFFNNYLKGIVQYHEKRT